MFKIGDTTQKLIDGKISESMANDILFHYAMNIHQNPEYRAYRYVSVKVDVDEYVAKITETTSNLISGKVTKQEADGVLFNMFMDIHKIYVDLETGRTKIIN